MPPSPTPTTIQTSVKFSDFAELTVSLILRRSFQCCRQIFPNLLNSWKGLFRTDMQIKFNVDLYSKDYFVSNVIKFSFQVIKIAFKRIKIFCRSIKFCVSKNQVFHWCILRLSLGHISNCYVINRGLHIDAFFGIRPLQIYGFTGEFPFGGFLFCFLVYSVLSRAIMALGFIFKKCFGGFHISYRIVGNKNNISSSKYHDVYH